MADSSRTLQVIIQAKDEASKVLSSFGQKLTSTTESLKPLGVAMTAVGAATGLLAKSFVDAAGDMQATRTAFDVLIGDSNLAKKTLNDLLTLEAKTPFTLQTIMSESKKLLAMGTDAKDLTKTLTILGDVAAGVGFEKLPQLTLAFGQIQAKGRLMGTELRQLTEAGFNLADAMGISSEKLDELISDKAVGFEDVRKAFEKVTGEGGRFNGMMDKLSKTTPGKLSTLESSVYKLKVAFGEALLPIVNRLVDFLIPALEGFQKFAEKHQTLTVAAIGLGLALGVLGVALLAIGGAITLIGAVVGAVGIPVLLVLGAAVVGLGAAFAVLTAYWPQVQAFFTGIILSIQMAALWFTNLVTVTIPAFIMGLIAWFQQLPTMVGTLIYNFFIIDLPYAIGYFVGYVYAVIPQMVAAFISFMSQLPPKLLTIMVQVYSFIVTKLTETWAWISKEVSQWPGKIQGFLITLPELVGAVLDSLKKAFTGKLNEIWGVVMSWKDKVVGAFNAVVDAVNRAIDALKKGFSAGVKGGGGSFQHGGFVPGSYSQPVPAILHGGERVIPRTGVDVNSGGGNGGGVTINFSGPVSMDSEERVRDLAEKINDMLGRQNELAAKGVGF